MRKCPQCKEIHKSHFSYCSKCGHKLELGHPKRKSRSKDPVAKAKKERAIKNYSKPIFISTMLLVLFCFFLFWMVHENNEMYPDEIVTTNASTSTMQNLISQPSLDTDFYQVASYFECGCGNCENHELVTCECPTAISQKEYIQKHLDEGKNFNEVRLLVYENFGNAKSKYSNWFQSQFKRTLQNLN